MKWIKVKEYLAQEIQTNLNDAEKVPFNDWLTKLEESDENKRLGLCLAIDLKIQSIHKETLIKVFKGLKVPIINPRTSFASSLKLIQSATDTICLTNYQSSKTFLYSRILTEKHFIDLIELTFGNKYPDDINFIISDLTNSEGKSKLDFEHWKNRMEFGWLSLTSEINTQKSIYSKSLLTTNLVNNLGLNHFKNGELVIHLELPENIEFTRSGKPTTLENNWKYDSDNYLSCSKKHEFGSTFSIDGTGQALSEKIYFKPISKPIEMKIEILGRYNKIVNDRNQLIEEGFKRLSNA